MMLATYTLCTFVMHSLLVLLLYGTGLFGHEARFAFRVFLKIRRFIMYTPKFSGTGTGLRFQI